MQYFHEIDEILGSRSSRYFGEGYRKTNQRVLDFKMADHGEGLTFSCIGQVHMPELWSAKAGKVQTPHLSTIDVLELSQECLRLVFERTLRHADLSAGTIERIDIVAGNEPVETSLDAIAIEGRIAPGEHGASNLIVNIANMTVTTVFAAESAFKGRRIGDGKQGVAVGDVMLHTSAMRGSGVVQPETARAGEAWSVSGCFAAGLQLGQVLLYALDNIERGASNTLWMKRTSLVVLPTTPEVGAAQPLVTKLENVRRYTKSDGDWRRADINSFMANIGIVCSVTHRLPH